MPYSNSSNHPLEFLDYNQDLAVDNQYEYNQGEYNQEEYIQEEYVQEEYVQAQGAFKQQEPTDAASLWS